MKKNIILSVDIETDGPIVPDFSMLSFGAAAFTPDGTMLGTFDANLEKLPNAKEDPSTMEFWSKNQSAYDATRVNLQDPKIALTKFVEWVEALDGVPTFVGYPAGFDFSIMYWYMMHFVGRSPFSFSALDMKTYASAILKIDYRSATKRNFPKHWFPKNKHTHIAIDDAIEQGLLFINMLKDNQ